MNIIQVSSLLEALEKINEGNKPLAGCTNILVDLHKKGDDNRSYVSLNCLDELKGIAFEDGVSFGSMTTFTDVEKAFKGNETYKAFYDCAYSMGSPQIRNVATVGGNIGDASPACDFAPPLLVFDGVITASSVDGAREIKASDFFQNVRKTALKENELITKIRVKNTNGKSSFQKVGVRNALSISIVSLATLIENGKVKFAMGSVAPIPKRLTSVENYVNGGTKITVEGLKAELQKDICPISDVRASKEYRFEVALNLIKDQLKRECGYDL